MQNIGTPRFYVNVLEYLAAIGYTEIDNVHRLNPTELKSSPNTETNVPNGMFTEKSFVAFLGHTGGNLGISEELTSDIAINIDSSGIAEHNGFSISSFDGRGVENSISAESENDIGSIVLGNYYDMPIAPDLSLKIRYEYDGIKAVKTKGGATLSNAIYSKPADWGNGGAWQLGTDMYNYRSGRRVFELSFSFLQDSDLMPKVASTTNYAGSYETAVPSDNTILEGTDFYSQVINRTFLGHLPFIFQIDKDNNSPDQFAICKFDMKSFEINQVSLNIYNCKLKLIEVW